MLTSVNTPAATVFRWMTMVGYFGLLGLLLNWYTWLSPPQVAPVSLVLAVLVVPLLIPLRGLLHARPYTHAWIGFLALFYFALGVDVSFNTEPDRIYGLMEVFFSLLLFFGGALYARAAKVSGNPVATNGSDPIDR